MADKFETKCWLCNSTDIEPDARGMVCRSCGATYSIVAKPGHYPISMQDDPMLKRQSASPVVKKGTHQATTL